MHRKQKKHLWFIKIRDKQSMSKTELSICLFIFSKLKVI